MTDIKKGDRVRVTFESVASEVSSVGLNLHNGHTFVNIKQEGVTVEKIEPPVEVFKPGDVVRNSAWTYALGTDGFLTIASAYGHPVGTFSRYGENGRYEASDFTTKWFERVNPDSPTR